MTSARQPNPVEVLGLGGCLNSQSHAITGRADHEYLFSPSVDGAARNIRDPPVEDGDREAAEGKKDNRERAPGEWMENRSVHRR
ncbi:hypothetical protein TNCV_2847111 [Trichonephila clavipes]|nr:hypothetical protein TNCV_2847111 [Trichonephila clavipes]